MKTHIATLQITFKTATVFIPVEWASLIEIPPVVYNDLMQY